MPIIKNRAKTLWPSILADEPEAIMSDRLLKTIYVPAYEGNAKKRTVDSHRDKEKQDNFLYHLQSSLPTSRYVSIDSKGESPKSNKQNRRLLYEK